MIHPVVAEKLPELRALCKKHRVEKMWLFGSATTDAFDPQHRDIDLIAAEAVKNPYLIAEVNQTKQLLYAA